MKKPEMTKQGLRDCQVCVPQDWTDKEVIAFAESKYPSGTSRGWRIRREDDPLLIGMPERNPCLKRKGFVHIMLDA